MKRSFLILLFLVVQGGNARGQTCPPGPPESRYDGSTEGTPLSDGGRQYSFEYAETDGYDCFERFKAWYPRTLYSRNALNANHTVLDMAYAAHGTAAFYNIVVPSTRNYTLTIRYAFDFGLFPGVTDRPEGIKVNGVAITYNMHFPITYSFEDYDCSSILIPLNKGKNIIEIFNVSRHGLARVDTMMVTPGGNVTCSEASPQSRNEQSDSILRTVATNPLLSTDEVEEVQGKRSRLLDDKGPDRIVADTSN
jgi:hypothetical protein